MHLTSILSFLLLLVLNLQFVLAQETSGTARIYTQPALAVIKVDGKFVVYGNELKLDSGIHVVEAWIEGYAFIQKEFRLSKDEFKTVRVKLLRSEEYVLHRKKFLLYRTQKNMLRYIPIMAYTGYAAISLNKLRVLSNDADKNYALATEAKTSYNNGFWLNDIEENRFIYNESKAAYEQNIKDINKKRTEFAIVTGGAAIIGFLTWKAASKLEKPILKDESQMHRFTFTPIILPTTSGVHLAYRF
jgi:hypothetical protein